MFEPDFDVSFEKRIIQAFKINIINQSPCKLPLLNFKVGTLKQMFLKKTICLLIFSYMPYSTSSLEHRTKPETAPSPWSRCNGIMKNNTAQLSSTCSEKFQRHILH